MCEFEDFISNIKGNDIQNEIIELYNITEEKLYTEEDDRKYYFLNKVIHEESLDYEKDDWTEITSLLTAINDHINYVDFDRKSRILLLLLFNIYEEIKAKLHVKFNNLTVLFQNYIIIKRDKSIDDFKVYYNIDDSDIFNCVNPIYYQEVDFCYEFYYHETSNAVYYLHKSINNVCLTSFRDNMKKFISVLREYSDNVKLTFKYENFEFNMKEIEYINYKD